MEARDYIRQRFFPQIWCPGCGHGTVMSSLVRAVDNLGIHKNNVAVISGIGCSSRMPGYLDFHTMHTLHGRALAFATGVKMGRPDMTLIVPMGDGDAAAIGGNHLIHAARRNMDLTALVLNNNVYGMTGGQLSPTAPMGTIATTAPTGSLDPGFDLVGLAMGAGASFVARTTTYHVKELVRILTEAIAHKGFSLLEVMCQCPTYYGRKNKIGSAVDMLRLFKEKTAPFDSEKMKINPELIGRGVFKREDRSEYSQTYLNLMERFAKGE